MPSDPYTAAKEIGLFRQIPQHAYSDINAETIVKRILEGRQAFEERQKRKGQKGEVEEGVRRREDMERAEMEKRKQMQQ